MTPLTPEQIEALNPGIRHTVLTLRSWGYDTRDSGDGKTRQFECDMPVPYVHIETKPDYLIADSHDLYRALASVGIVFSNAPHPQDDPEGFAKHPSIEASYSPVDGHAIITLTNVIIPEP